MHLFVIKKGGGQIGSSGSGTISSANAHGGSGSGGVNESTVSGVDGENKKSK